MATATTDSERQLDEFGQPIPTQEEMASEQATQEQERLKNESKTAQTLQLVGAMNQTVAPLPMTLPTQAAPQGRMYMGPASGSALDRFTAGQGPSNVNLMPPPTPDQSAGAGGRVAAATGGESDPAALARLQAADPAGVSTIGVHSESPYSDASLASNQNMMKYEAMKKYQAGDHSPEVMAMLLGKTASTGKRYNVAGVGLVDENGRVIAAHKGSRQTRTVQGVGLVDAVTGEVIVPSVQKPDTNTVTKHFAAVPAVAGTPAQPASKGLPILGWGAHPAIPATPGVPEQPPTSITSKVPVGAPASTAKRKVGSFKVGDILDGYRFKGGDETDKKNWEKI